MGCFCSMKMTMNDAIDQGAGTPSSSVGAIHQSTDTSSSSSPSPLPLPLPPQALQWNSPPPLWIPPQPHPAPLQWNSPPMLWIAPQPHPAPPPQSSPAEQMPRFPKPSPLSVPTERSASPRRALIDRGSAISHRVLIEQRGRPPPSPRRVPTERSTSVLSSPRRALIEWSMSPPPGDFFLLEPSDSTTDSEIDRVESPSVGTSSPSAPSAPVKKHSQNFAFRDLAVATGNFNNAKFLGEGGYGKVYKGELDSGQVVAVKVLRKMGVQGNKEFLTELLMLTMLKHPNLIRLVGFCSEGDQRLLVYEFMPCGTLLDHLFNLPPNREPLDWNTRMKIIVGVANGLHYLHDLADPPIIYLDMKPENILLDDDFNPKLSDFGLTKLAPAGDDAYVFTRILENQGYCDPEYVATGKLSKKSDVYSFGILMLELISGRSVYDETAPRLLAWASACLSDRSLYVQLVDPLLQGCFERHSLDMLAPVIGFCINREPCLRPPIREVVKAVADAAFFSYDSQPFSPSTASPQSSASL